MLALAPGEGLVLEIEAKLSLARGLVGPVARKAMLRQDRADLFQKAHMAIPGDRFVSGLVVGESPAQAIHAESKAQNREHKRTRAHQPLTLDEDPHWEPSKVRSDSHGGSERLYGSLDSYLSSPKMRDTAIESFPREVDTVPPAVSSRGLLSFRRTAQSFRRNCDNCHARGCVQSSNGKRREKFVDLVFNRGGIIQSAGDLFAQQVPVAQVRRRWAATRAADTEQARLAAMSAYGTFSGVPKRAGLKAANNRALPARDISAASRSRARSKSVVAQRRSKSRSAVSSWAGSSR